MNILLLQGSSRENGNTEYLTNLILKDISHKQINLRDLTIRPIVDQRHDELGFAVVQDDYDSIIDDVLQADILIFATPLYWYGMSGLMKNFVDRWSQSLRSTRYKFKEEMQMKQCYVVICGGDNPSIKALPLVQQFQYIFNFMGMRFEDYIIGKASRPGEIVHDQFALKKAEQLNERFKNKL